MKRNALKSIISMVLIIFILFINNIIAMADKSDYKEISLSEAIETARANNNAILLADEKVKAAQRQYNYAMDEYRRMRNEGWSPRYSWVENAKKEQLHPMMREQVLDEAKYQRDNTIRDIEALVRRLYYKALLLQEKHSIQGNELENMKAQYQALEKQLELGIAKESDVLKYRILLGQAETGLLTVRRDMDENRMRLNETLGFDVDNELVLKDEELPDAAFKVNNLDKVIHERIQNAFSIKKLEASKRLNEIERGILRTYVKPEPEAEIDNINAKIEGIPYDIRDEKVTIEYKIRSDYNKILNLEDDVRVKALDKEKASKLCDVSKKKLELGLINESDYNKAVIDRDKADLAYKEALLEYHAAVEEFKNFIYPAEL